MKGQKERGGREMEGDGGRERRRERGKKERGTGILCHRRWIVLLSIVTL